MNNPLLLDQFNTPFEAIPFNLIKTEHYEPAFKEGIKLAENDIQLIIDNKDEPTFKNTIEALDKAGEKLELISGVFFNMNSAETNDEIQQIAQKVSPLLTNHGNNILLNEALFNKVKSVYDQKANLNLNPEQETLLTKTYKSFARNGALLSEEDKVKLRDFNNELSLLSLKFGENVLAESNAYQLVITNADDLAGLPESAVEAAKQLAEESGSEGWVFTLDYPSYIPFVTYCDNRELRKKMYEAFSSKANQNNEFDNKEIVHKLVALKSKKARLLGYESYADYVLEERMAKSKNEVLEFLDSMYPVSFSKATDEAKVLQDFAIKLNGPAQLQKWDVSYYTEKLKIEQISFDEEKLKPYFKLENVIDGVFKVANKLFGLNFKERTDIPVYHPEVKTYVVIDENGEFVALFYGDFFPRKGKRQGAWMTSYKSQFIDDKGVNHRPHVVNVCNFTKPTKTKPSLLTFNEVTTLFHEFGHALHGMLANVTYTSLSGTSVLWDFVELPSQLLENWCYEKEALDLFATHYETGELIPQSMIDQIKKSATFRSGSASLRQLSFGKLDINWHSLKEEEVAEVKSVEQFEKNCMNEFELYDSLPNSLMSTQFSHIFQGGYSAGYYSYKWAEVLEADAFESFLEKGVFNKDVANDFKNNILAKGGVEDPELLFTRFKGRKAETKALLKKLNLIEEKV